MSKQLTTAVMISFFLWPAVSKAQDTKAPAKVLPGPTTVKVGTAAPVAKAEPAKKAEVAKKEEPKSVEEAFAVVKSVWSAFKGGKYREMVAGIIVILLFVWRRFISKFVVGKLSKWWLTFVALLLGYLGSIPEALTMDPFSWWKFVWTGLITGAEAITFWLLIGKKVLPKLFGGDKKWQEAKKPA